MVARIIALHPDRNTTPPHDQRTEVTAGRRRRPAAAPFAVDPYRTPAGALETRRGWSRRGSFFVAAVLAAVTAGAVGVAHHVLTPDAVRAPSFAPAEPTRDTADGGEVDWQRVQGVWFPTSTVEGPTGTDGITVRGFSATDLGAALAAVHIVYRASAAPGPAVFTSALREQVTGPAAAALTTAVQADYDRAREGTGLPDGAALGSGSATFLGYRITAMPNGNRAVQIVEQARDETGVARFVAFDVVLTRGTTAEGASAEGDWKVIAPAAGTWASAFTQLPEVPADLVRFTPAAPTTPDGTTPEEGD